MVLVHPRKYDLKTETRSGKQIFIRHFVTFYISFSFFQFGTISALHTLSALQNNTRSQSSFPATQNDEISEFQLRMCINTKPNSQYYSKKI